MNSLSELNGFGATSLTVNDDRPSKIIFDRAAPLRPIDQVYAITSTTVNVTPGINILEVVNYTTANVRYRVAINTSGSPLLTGSTISWASIPSGVTYTVAGNVYTLGNIDSKAIWDQIKNFTWNLPANYATRPNWYLQVSIIYYDSALGRDVTTSWLVYDEDFYYVAEFSSSFAVSCIAEDVRLFSASMFCSTGLAVDPKLLEGIINTVAVSATLSCEARLKPKDGELEARADITLARLTANPGNLRANITAISAILNVTPTIIFNITDRIYVANDENPIFDNSAPFIDDTTLVPTTYELSLSSPIGVFSLGPTGTTYSTLTLSGTAAQVSNYFTQIKFYPNKNTISNSTLNFLLKRNTVTVLNQTVNLTYAATAGPVPSAYFVFTRIPSWSIKTQSQYSGYPNFIFVTGTTGYNWSPPNRQRIYATTKMIVFGAGGNGGDTSASGAPGGGGGSGAILRLDNYPLPTGTIIMNPGSKEISGDANTNSSITLPDGTKINVPNGTNAMDRVGGGAADDGGSAYRLSQNVINSHSPEYIGGIGGPYGGGGASFRENGENSSLYNRVGRGGRGYEVNTFPLQWPNTIPVPSVFGYPNETQDVFANAVVQYNQIINAMGGNGGGISQENYLWAVWQSRGGPWKRFDGTQTLYNDGENARGYGNGGGGAKGGTANQYVGGKGGPGLIIVYFGDS